MILHAGEAVFKTIRQSEEMAGEDVILVHHLLKNSIPSNEYILMTEAFHHLIGGQNDPSLEKRLESYGDLGEVAIHVAFPHRKTESELSAKLYRNRLE